MKLINKYKIFILFISLFITTEILIIQNLDTEKKATLYLLFIVFVILSTFKFVEKKQYKILYATNNFSNVLTFISLIPVVLITQNFDLNFEQITWDTASYLVASQEVGLGYIPFETSWESKGPLLFYIYYLLNLISFKSYIYFRIVNDLIIVIISFLIIKIIQLKHNNYFISYASGLMFVVLTSKEWYVSEFTEIYCIAVLSFAIYLKEKDGFSKLNIVAILLSLSSLINQGSILFILPFLWWVLSDSIKQKNYKNIKNFLIFLSLPQIFTLAVYSYKNLLDLYLANYITIPLSYAGDSLSSIYELRVWIREFYNFNFLIYASIFLIFLVYLLENLKNIPQVFGNFYVQSIAIAVGYYFAGSHNFYHHLFYVLFFICFFISKMESDFHKFLVVIIVFISTSITFSTFFNKSFSNLSNLDNLQQNYPLYQLSNEIDSYFENDDYTILAIDYVLVLHYLEKQNYAYIVHPTNHFEDYIENTLINLGYIKSNNIEKLINEEPDVILCNDTLIIRGEQQNIVDFNCNIDEYKQNYIKLDTEIYNNNLNRDRYRDDSKIMNVFIKNS